MSNEKKYKIESHIPIPGRGGPREGTSEFIETLLKLEVGDSFVFKRYKVKEPAEISSDRGNVYNRYLGAFVKRKLNRKLSTRLLMDGDGWVLRVWRIL